MPILPTSASTPPEEQFAQLLANHQRQLFGLIFGMVHSVADSEDVFQQSCLVMWQKFADFEPGSNFGAWAASIARFKAIDFLRSKGRDRLQFSPELLEQFVQQQDSRAVHSEARARALDECKQKLPARDQHTLRLCYQPDTTIKQAAEELQRPVGSVYDSLTRIRRALMSCIQKTLAMEGNV
jgi:RNA polymerase sigma-70 factor (ECF subfamily)